ncbi:carboxypeptidase regulatory-like domain-containing protein [Rhodohalobacter sp. SW132]|uniref:carboxypeptidase-like regulatory domain-containing protein n=1 Tax=Rhodohalobacter sp. SW132 TaxID=2293433 RepID=UPI000E24F5DF|nr:carboxypeptidase-like regulatory domain-containing protein [Rhodohalobacter sp. SW132]REL33651.1 carboxypeptidase regulatory-like domain-containing protein [Rhodohalobacter sp. SW132]
MNKLKVVLLFLLITAGQTAESTAQTTIKGTVTSLNGELIPNIVLTPHPAGQTTIFNRPTEVIAGPEGSYEITIAEPGIYNLSIAAVHHQNLRLPVMIYDQENIEMDIRLVPRYYNNGMYFDQEPYREWIRVYGNFNNYDFHTAPIFDLNSDGSISATIPADRDTVRYQVRGISGGPVPLPGEALTAIRPNRTFEGVIIPPANADSIELRFDPNEQTKYQKNVGPISPTPAHRPNARLSFSNPSDYFWIQPLSLVQTTYKNYEINSSDNTVEPDSNDQNNGELSGWMNRIANNAKKYRKEIRTTLEDDSLHPQQRAALYIAYLGLLNQQVRWNEHVGEDSPEDGPGPEFLLQVIQEVHPLHPVWGRNPGAATQLLEQSGFNPEVVEYSEKMVREHTDDLVVRYLVLELIEKKAHQYEDAREMPEYSWIVERYGENHLARQAIVAYLRGSRTD